MPSKSESPSKKPSRKPSSASSTLTATGRDAEVALDILRRSRRDGFVLSAVIVGQVAIHVQADLRALAVPAPGTGKGRGGESTILKDVGGDVLAAAIAKDAADAARETASGSTVPEDEDDDNAPGTWQGPGGGPADAP